MVVSHFPPVYRAGHSHIIPEATVSTTTLLDIKMGTPLPPEGEDVMLLDLDCFKSLADFQHTSFLVAPDSHLAVDDG